MRSRTSRRRMSSRRSRSSESCKVGTPCSRGPGATVMSVSALPPRATAMLSPRLGRDGNRLERDASLLFDMPDERVAVARFARGAGGHSAIAGYAKFVHYFLEVTESFHTLFENVFTEAVTKEDAFAEAQRVTFVMQRLNVQRRIGARHGKAHG